MTVMEDAAPAGPVATASRMAWAKVNLTLHCTGQRADGYHLLDSLVVRVGVGDALHVAPAEILTLTISGPRAKGVPTDARNLVLRAAEMLDAGAGRGAALHLVKHLPAAAGIGGGSADAAVALELLSAHWGVPLPADTARLGADVPVCLTRGPQRMQGVGEILTPLPPLPACHIVLVNPGVDVPTPAVFAALTDKNQPPMPDVIPKFANFAEFVDFLRLQRNDLAAPAIARAPVIASCLEALSDAALARMSGSGATCFGIYATAKEAETAAHRITTAAPNWWVAAAPILVA
ncbi:4-diphosphocytidyl-2-C-methyl-D-erythritol kinase [Sulfitobacter indolifex]|uniref:4-diphosphocytidyl-2-C-methyl-D-erythritol kinase n=2 Tax=Sulfitobacter indolifex TaxID=225422 RepID=A0ABM9XBK2_9RHOB|nr:Putative 4-diphosphocytidyl-2C-methyl-D-erythritol kinase [Sulfitobacter indolifex HEL-45]UOA17885.1 4-diphosphocytidyl-2-C-methyl-D-erythritol kinase [Sulfitobacter indolifex]